MDSDAEVRRGIAAEIALRWGLSLPDEQLDQLGRSLDAGTVERLTTTLERMTDGFVALDREWRVTCVNRQAERILRRDRTSMLGRELWTLFENAVGTEFERQYRGAVEDRKPRHIEANCAALDLWVDVHAYPCEGGLELYFRDATGRKHAELALRQSEESLRLATTAGGLGTWQWSSADGQLVVSEQTRILFGIPPGVHVTRGTLFQVIHPEDRAASIGALQAAVESGNELHADFRIVRPDGSVRWMTSFGRGYPDEERGGIRVEGVVLDITNRKRDEDQLRELNEQLEQRVAQRTRELVEATRQAEAANEAKSVFLATMSHEIRTPMNGIVGMVDVLSHGHLSEYQGEAVRTIRESAFALLHLIDDVLDFSKIEAGKLELERTPVPFVDIAESVCETLSPLADLKGVDVFLFVTPHGPARVWWDPVRLRQILYNLVGNAIKFSGGRPARRGRVDVRIEVASETPFRVRMRVTDNGIGMTPEVQRDLFQSFRQAEISTTRRFGGSGLGLAICKRLVDLAGGTIGVESTPGRGATFTVELPLDPLPEPATACANMLDGVDFVIVSRSYMNAEDLRVYLDFAGARTHMVEGASEAIEACGRLADPVVVHSLPDDTMRPRWLSLFAHMPHVRHLIISRGRRRVARLAAPNVVTIDGNALRRRALLHAAAVAAGRASATALATAADPEEIVEPPTAPTVAEARARGQLILVAEDDSTNQKVLLRQLELLGYAAEVAGDGIEALNLWRKGGYALLITDLHMPNLDGYGLTASIRREEAPGQRVPVIALTANAVRGEAARALSAGLDEYLTKPLQLAVLGKVLEKLLSPLEPGTGPGTAEAPEPAVLDIGILIRLVGDSPGAVAEMLDDYARSLHASLPGLRDALATGELGEVGRVAHRLKSSSRAIGALPMGDLCAELENACRLWDRAAVAQLMTRFEATTLELLSQIRRSAEGET